MMYRERIIESIGKVYQAGVATKILQYMNKIRNESDITQARRWVMELLQNARDLAWEDKPLLVQIELKDNALYFRHNGKPFRVKDILSIINQVSSKNPGEGVGQFGTGFMTTYQLSEKVEIHSILKEEDVPGKKFSVTLDRTGHSREAILDAISHNLDQLGNADALPDVSEESIGEGYDTEFCYLLESKRSRDIAKIGVTDLMDTIIYVMLFSERIDSVELIFDTEERCETITYRRDDTRNLLGSVEELTVVEDHSNGEQKLHTLLFTKNNGLTLAAEYDTEQGFLPISERTPRIFVDFPLIGAEQFPFPVVINSLSLHPNEPRSGISLVDNSDSVEAQENKSVMLSAVRAYERFVGELVQINVKGTENIISIPERQYNKEWSEDWVNENLYGSIYEIIRELPIFPTSAGNKSLSDSELYIICGSSEEEKNDIKKLTAPLNGYLTPDDDTDWYKVLGSYQISDEKIIDLKRLLSEASSLMKNDLDKEQVSAMEWNCRLYEAAMNVPELSMEIQAGNIAVFPSQSPEEQKVYKLYTVREIFRDPGIPECLKDVAEKVCELDILSGKDQPKLRSLLLPQEFRLTNEHIIPEQQLSAVIEYIRTHCDRGYRVVNYNLHWQEYEKIWHEAWFLMLSCGPDDKMYKLCRKCYPTAMMPERNKIEDSRISGYLWRTTYCSVLNNIIGEIETLQTLDQLKTESPYDLLNILYKECITYLHEGDLNYRKIFPDQEGNFKELRMLSADGIRDNELKEIALSFQQKEPYCNMYRELLDSSVILEGWSVSKKHDIDAAMRINNVVQKLLMECSLSQAELIYQEACNRLLGWIEEHHESACEYFPAFSKEEDQMKLLTPRAAASMHRKAKEFGKLIEMLGTDDPEEIEKIVKKMKDNERSSSVQSEYHEETGIWLDDELMSMEEDERGRICREIGEAGELCAYELVCRSIMENGCQLSEESSGIAVYVGDNVEYTVIAPNNGSHHQAGWDIKVVRKTETEETVYFIEIKTHTLKSIRRGVLKISNEQMKLAAEHMENYIILSVIYDYRQKQIQQVNAYRDPCRQLANGVLRNLSDGFWLAEYPSVQENVTSIEICPHQEFLI